MTTPRRHSDVRNSCARRCRGDNLSNRGAGEVLAETVTRDLIMAQVVTTAQADEMGIRIVEPLISVNALTDPYLRTRNYEVVAPPELGDDPNTRQQELDRWAKSRNFVRVARTN